MWMYIVVALLATMVAAWIGMATALTHGARLRELEAAVRRLQATQQAAPAPAAPAATAETESIAPASGPDSPESASPEPASPFPSSPAPAATPPAAGGLGAMFRALERSLAGNWLVWVAGAALAMGGVMLARYALDRGLLGPEARLGAVLLAGAAMLGAGEWLRRKPGAADRVRSLAPAVLSGAGIITLYGGIYAGFAVFGLIPGAFAFILLAAISGGALLLAWLHGPVIAAFGVAGAFATPLLIGAEAPNAAGLFAYVFGVAAASLAMARFARWRWTVWLSLAGGAGWPALWLMAVFDPSQALALAIYLPALAALAVAFAWDEAEGPPPMRRFWPRTALFAPPSVLAAHACFAAACLLCLWLIAAWGGDAATSHGALFVVCALGLAAAWRRESFAILPVIGAAAAVFSALLWPDILAARIADDAGIAEADPRPAFASAIAFAALFGVGGWFAQARLRLKGAMAMAASGAPVGLAAALALSIGAADAPYWAALLAAMALIQTSLVEIMVRSGHGTRAPGPVAAYALGACGAVLAALILVLDRQWIGAGIAVQALAAAWLMRRWGSPALVWASALLGLAAVYQLVFGAQYLAGPPRGLLAGVSLVLAYVVGAAALDAASRTLRHVGVAREHAAMRTLDGAAAILGVTGAFLALRLLTTGGAVAAPYGNLLELGLQSSLWLALAFALRLRVRAMTLVQRLMECALIVVALLHIVLFQLITLNPWTGFDAPPVLGPPVLNELLAAYGLPAFLLGALAVLWRRRGLPVAPYAACGAAIMFFVWITLETRRAFHAPDLSASALGDAESWAYSTVWLLGAALVMALGVARRIPILRYMALCALIATSLKVFLFDLSGLEGLWRALSFLGLGAALMAIAVIYQRIVLPGAASESAPQDERPA